MDIGAVILIVLAVYFLPTVIAIGRERSNAGSIFVVNLFLGWTLIGWVVALAWSVAGLETKEVRPRIKEDSLPTKSSEQAWRESGGWHGADRK